MTLIHVFPKNEPSRNHLRLAGKIAMQIEESDVFEDTNVEVLWESWQGPVGPLWLANITCSPTALREGTACTMDIEIAESSWIGQLYLTEGREERVRDVFGSDATDFSKTVLALVEDLSGAVGVA